MMRRVIRNKKYAQEL